jgi:hypothetical protein
MSVLPTKACALAAVPLRCAAAATPSRALPQAHVRLRRPSPAAVFSPRRRSKSAAVINAPRACAAAAATPSTAALPASVLGSACVAAAATVLLSLCTRSGRARWAALFVGFRQALPANPSLRRALAWLPLVAVAKLLESLFGLPLLNLVYVAASASTVLQAIAAAQALPPSVPWAGAAGATAATAATAADGTAPSPVHPAAAAQQAARMVGINQLALGLFAQRFPELAAQPVLATSPAVVSAAAGDTAQGQLYVTASHVAFHGTFGRGARVVPLADITAATVEPATAQLSVLLLATPEGELRVTAVQAMCGDATLAALFAAWRAARDAGGEAAA